MIITGIGSRETPDKILQEMELIGAGCRLHGFTMRSGHAPGADWAFENGAQERCIAYLPWKGFNKELVSKAHLQVVPWDDKYYELTKQFHPNHMALSRGALSLMNRNSCQVLGLNLDRYADCVICWTKDGNDTGGTGQALRIAKHFKIPVYNMYFEELNSFKKLMPKILKHAA